MRLMTYNIRLGIQQGLDPIARHITAQRADVVALQEVGDHWVMGPSGDTTRELSRLTELPYALHIGTILRREEARYGHALLSRWPLRSPTVHMLPIVKDEQRAILSVTLDAPDGPILLLTTHLSWLIQDRPAHGALLTDMAAHEIAQGNRVVIMGDLNEDDPEAPWLQSLRAIMSDADHDLARLTFPSKAPRVRLDLLLTSIGTWREVTVVEDAQASDHFALAATLHLATEGEIADAELDD
jgi:endonuclease/exonuclease/phosphatase family metal-dependent hydrolase